MLKSNYSGVMMDGEEGTTKYAEGAKREATLLFKEKNYKIVGGCFEVYSDNQLS
jgi:hypothetical protein